MLLVAERETRDSVSGSWNHVVKEQFGLLVRIQIDSVVILQLVSESVIHCG